MILQRFDLPELQRRGAPCVRRIHPGGDLLVDQRVEGRAQLVVEIACNAIPVTQVAPEVPQACKHGHCEISY